MSGQRHPDTEALASLRAGLIRGLRGRRLAAHVGRCARCACVSDELGAVSSTLASAPAPTLPEAFENRITAAIGAEAAARESAASAAGATRAGAAARDSAERATPAPRPRPARARHGHPGWRLRPAMAAVPLIALVLAGFGYLLSNSGASSSSSSAASEPGPEPAALSASAPAPAADAPGAGARARPPVGYGRDTFVVTESGTHYEAATLRAQVLSQLAAHAGTNAVLPSAVPSPSASGPTEGLNEHAGAAGSSGAATASPALASCALSVTKGVRPSLVDRATYDGKAAYVIAVPGHAWVVGLGCTASNTELIASVALPAAP